MIKLDVLEADWQSWCLRIRDQQLGNYALSCGYGVRKTCQEGICSATMRSVIGPGSQH